MVVRMAVLSLQMFDVLRALLSRYGLRLDVLSFRLLGISEGFCFPNLPQKMVLASTFKTPWGECLNGTVQIIEENIIIAFAPQCCRHSPLIIAAVRPPSCATSGEIQSVVLPAGCMVSAFVLITDSGCSLPGLQGPKRSQNHHFLF